MYSKTARRAAPRRPQVAMDQLAFQGRNERFRHRVIVRVTHAPHPEGSIPACLRVRPELRQVYCRPWSEWWISPSAGFLLATATLSASTTSSARMCSAIDPTHYFPAVGIEHERENWPAFRGQHVRDVQPEPVGGHRRGSGASPGRRQAWHPCPVGWYTFGAPRNTPEARRSHQPRYPQFCPGFPAPQLDMHPQVS